MAFDAVMKEINFDRYERNARLRPALFTALPFLVLVEVWSPRLWNLFGTLETLIVTCGVTFLMAQIARQRGRSLERRWKPTIGRSHSARLLSHTDTTLPAATKSRYHAFFSTHGFVLPTVQQERDDPDGTQDQYLSAINWLLEYTRPNAGKSLLLEENIAYGFRRNLVGLKPFAMIILSLAIAADIALLWQSVWASPMFETGAMVGGGMVVVALIWIFLVTRAFVEDASLAYGQRLLAQCEVTSAKASPKAKKAAGAGHRKIKQP